MSMSGKSSVASRCPRIHFLSRQGGNGLVFALLGLLVSALVAGAALRASELQVRRDAGNAEATVLDSLRNASNNAIFEQMVAIQNGRALTKNGVTVAPVFEDGQAVWKPSIPDLVAMGYLPTGWSARVSTLNQAPYTISFTRVPAECQPATCNIEGHVILEGSIRSGASATDGAVIGPILTRLGSDSGVSLPARPEQITGFGNSWTTANPVNGQPPGVVGVRIGTAASGFGQFVRIGDSRDPDLAGNLTVAGDTVFGSGSTTSLFKAAVNVEGSVTSSGRVTSGDGYHTANIDAFGSADPGAIAVKAGDFVVKNSSGESTLRVASSGDVNAPGNVDAGADVHARGLTLTATVSEGDACSTGQIAMLTTGGLATCQATRFQATTRYATLGSSCAVAGQLATDPDRGDAMVCRQGYFASLSGFMSSKVYMSSFSVGHGAVVSLATALPQGCPATAGPVFPQAAIYLLPQTDSNTPGNPVLNRDARWNGSGWTVALTDGAGVPTSSLAIAEIFCVYP